MCYPGFYAVMLYRIAHELFLLHVPFLPRMITETAHGRTGIDIHPGATIGEYFFIDHGTGIVVGETTVIGNRVRLYQGVTLGAKSFRLDEDGNPVKGGKRHPTIGNNVMIGAGAKVLGGFTVGKGAKIGAGAVVLKEVPPYATVVGVPGNVVRINGQKLPDLEQEKRDPMHEEICHLREMIFTLEKKIEQIEKNEK